MEGVFGVSCFVGCIVLFVGVCVCFFRFVLACVFFFFFGFYVVCFFLVCCILCCFFFCFGVCDGVLVVFCFSCFLFCFVIAEICYVFLCFVFFVLCFLCLLYCVLSFCFFSFLFCIFYDGVFKHKCVCIFVWMILITKKKCMFFVWGVLIFTTNVYACRFVTWSVGFQKNNSVGCVIWSVIKRTKIYVYIYGAHTIYLCTEYINDQKNTRVEHYDTTYTHMYCSAYDSIQ